MLHRSPRSRKDGGLLATYGHQLGRLLDQGMAELAVVHARRLERTDALMHGIVRQSFDGILPFSTEARVVMANEAAARLFAHAGHDLAGRSFDDLFPAFDSFRCLAPGPAMAGGRRFEGAARRVDGREVPIELAISRIDLAGESGIVAVVRDIAAAKRQEARLRHLALHDPLTGLANRTLLHDRLVEAIASVGAGGEVALLLADLDRFKEINDTLGHDVGDRLLRAVAQRLDSAIGMRGMVARLGGDEFAILLAPGIGAGAAGEVAREVAGRICAPFALTAEAQLEVGVSIGIAIAPTHGRDPATLLRCADVAMYAAKRGGATVEIYDRDKDHHSLRHLALGGALRQAIAKGELVLHYQPKISLRSGAISGAEALLRWHHPRHGTIMPAEFVPQAEQTGVVHELTRWTIEQALAQIAACRALGLTLGVAVNLSPRSLHDEGVPDLIEARLAELDLAPGLLTVEITETAVLHDQGAAQRVLGRLHAMGVRLSVDDFGTGYSSLALLQRLSVDELKIDRSFVATMLENPQDLVLVRSTVELAHNLGLTSVAEGVEDLEQVRTLCRLGCDVAQGYLVSEARSSEALLDWFRTMPWQLPEGITAGAGA
jgi:diguanylate cyclase (GGDEF)-like protein/PAS domain S-box-containing protein